MDTHGVREGGDWEQMWLPLWPLATDDFLTGVYRMPRPDALERRHIEANPAALSNLLVVDVDHPDSALRALSAQGSHPMPNAIIENRRNGHAHLHWWLREPFTRTEYARRKPLAYAAAVTEGLRRAVDGDIGYSGLMTKNPVHADWDTHWLLTEPYELGQIEQALGRNMPPANWRRTRTHRESPTALGRNCMVFDSVRTWAYRPALMRQYLPTRDSDGLARAIHQEVAQMNAAIPRTETCPGPMQTSEARAIAASIHRWITHRSNIWKDGIAVYEAGLIARTSAGGRRMTDKRRETIAKTNRARGVDRAALWEADREC
ncbi:replication initiation protein [Rhodococcus pyridinivorans]|uniref:replication initiation protein n=1 Tax=Rhodococcus pyridinivorans TaxID=103816 RepID=UPI00265A2B74|nr:replication initiation protein [Rhodococcus pyridinivorans]